MTAGGARNRSGPKADPTSERSEIRGYKLTALPSEGYSGPIPAFPLAAPSTREMDLWNDAWRTPQACAWSLPSERWRIHSVGMWVRTAARAEDPDASASILAQLHRFADQIGLTTAGLTEMGWKVAVDEVAERAAAPVSAPAEVPTRRMRAVQ